MMSKKSFFKLTMAFLLLLTVSTPVGAQKISVDAARQAAASFLKGHAAKLPAKSRKGMMKAPPKAESLQLVYTQEDQLHESPALYVFEQPKQGGFVIASADERAYPILGYNESGTFREDSLPCCLKFMLEEYGRQMAKDDWLGAAEDTASQIETASDIAINALGEGRKAEPRSTKKTS